MRKIALIAFAIFVFFGFIYALMQSDIGRNLVKSALTKTLQESGYQVQIDQIEGTLPHQINLKGVLIEKDQFSLSIDELHMRPVLWRLVKREAAFTHIEAKGISISDEAHFETLTKGKFRIDRKRIYLQGTVDGWKFFARYHLKTNDAEFSTSGPWFVAKGTANFVPKLSARILFRSNLVNSSIDIQQEEEGYRAKALWQLAKHPLEGTATALYHNQTLQGSLFAANLAQANFDLKIEPNRLIQGTSDIKVENLQAIHIPNAFGKLQAKATWEASDNTQQLHLDGELTDFYYKDLFAETLSLYSDLTDPFGKIQGSFDIDAQKLKWKYLELESASFQTTLAENSSPYKLFAEGSLRHPFQIYSEGTWQNHYLIFVDTLNGTFIDSTFALNDPIQITYTDDIFKIPNARLTVGDGSLQFDIDRIKDETKASFHAKQIPIDFLSLNPLEVAVGGTITLDANIEEKDTQLSGKLSAEINQTVPMEAIGTIDARLNKDLLELKANLKRDQSPLLNLDLNLPISFSIWPFEAEILYHKNAKGDLVFDGKIEEILDYFDLGTSRLEGYLQGNLHFQSTLYRPQVTGGFTFHDGTYENYYTGTQLKNIRAEIIAKNGSLYLQSLTAEDPHETGTLHGVGKIDLLQSNFYPFKVDLTINNLLFSEIDLVTAQASGKVSIEGNALSALATGGIDIHKIEVTIPDHIPRPVPHLDVVYRNAIHPVAPPQRKDIRYPLRLDLNATAPADVTISGRGLTSNWRGDFHLGGTYTSLAAKGTLQLIEGEFNFSSRSFKLTEGSLNFSGIEHQMPYLNIAGEMETKGVVITARLKGPIDDPQLTLLSNPPLPLGSIMSYLLFGQDISEIGGFQALQLANSLASLAGTSPDVMETTRKSLGVDRLRVVTTPADEEGNENVALQVSKYISKGVLVSFTQGTEESSPDISVEIELKNNFVFQIESDQHQEQGRFTLKWNLNY